MLFSPLRAARFSFGVGAAAYVVASAGAVVVAAYAVWHVGVAVLESVAPAPAIPTRHAAATIADTRASYPPAGQSVRREGRMSVLAERGYGAWGVPGVRRSRIWESGSGASFGSSSRDYYQSYGAPRRDDWGGDEERPPVVSTYRTVCVRLCDGYYFPISFAVTSDRLDRDRNVCASRCGAQGRLFVHRSMDTSTDDMVDLQGRPYRNLPTAFLYRTEYVPTCKCQPDPWDAASLDRHRSYALAAAARKGDKDAAKELQALQAKMKEDAKTAAKATPPLPSVIGVGGPLSPAAAARQAEIAESADGNFMLLGGGGAPKSKGEPISTPPRSRGDGDWMKRTFDPGFGGR
jgi:hypothetical protein